MSFSRFSRYWSSKVRRSWFKWWPSLSLPLPAQAPTSCSGFRLCAAKLRIIPATKQRKWFVSENFRWTVPALFLYQTASVCIWETSSGGYKKDLESKWQLLWMQSHELFTLPSMVWKVSWARPNGVRSLDNTVNCAASHTAHCHSNTSVFSSARVTTSGLLPSVLPWPSCFSRRWQL